MDRYWRVKWTLKFQEATASTTSTYSSRVWIQYLGNPKLSSNHLATMGGLDYLVVSPIREFYVDLGRFLILLEVCRLNVRDQVTINNVPPIALQVLKSLRQDFCASAHESCKSGLVSKKVSWWQTSQDDQTYLVLVNCFCRYNLFEYMLPHHS